MVTDLFIHQTKQDKLLSWCKQKGLFSKADAVRWGIDNFYLRSDRTIRNFVQQGLVKKLSTDECLFRGLPTSMGWYSWDGR